MGNGWKILDCIGDIPQGREEHAAAVVDGVMYVFGGRDRHNHDFGDLAAFRIANRRWYSFRYSLQDMGPSPSPRSSHSMCVHDKKIFVIGGEPSRGYEWKGQEVIDELTSIYTLDTSKIIFPD